MARSKSSQRWLKEHFSDEYVKLAQAQNYRSRAVFKLKEIDERDQLFMPGMAVLDLGAAPGGWSQYALQRVSKQAKIVALDILKIDPIPGVEIIEGDFREDSVLEKLKDVLDQKKVNVILSDMAPNQSGVYEIDQPKSIYLAELALDVVFHSLVPGGTFLVKLFQGTGFDDYCRGVKQVFRYVSVRKPKASRPRSREVYLLAKDFKSC